MYVCMCVLCEGVFAATVTENCVCEDAVSTVIELGDTVTAAFVVVNAMLSD